MWLWIAIALLIDAGFALLLEDRYRRMAPSWNIKALALVEAGIALVIILVHFIRN